METTLVLIATPLVASLIQLAILYFLKVPTILQKQNETNEHLASAIENLNTTIRIVMERLDLIDERKMVGQRLFSDMLGVPIDIDAIAKDYSRYPKVGKVLVERRQTKRSS